MSKKKIGKVKLTNREEEIMQIIWELGKAFPKEIMEYLSKPVPPYNTILSMVRKLESNGWLAFKKFGKSHQYYPLIKKKDYSQSLFSKLYTEYLGGSKEMLMSYFMKEENVDIEELEKLVKQLKKEKKSKG